MDNMLGEIVSASVFVATQALFITKMLKMKKAALFVAVYGVIMVAFHVAGMIYWAESNIGIKIVLLSTLKCLTVVPFSLERIRRTCFVAFLMLATEMFVELLVVAVALTIVAPHVLISMGDSSFRLLWRMICYPVFLFAIMALYFVWNKIITRQSDASFHTFLILLGTQAITGGLSCIVIYQSGVATPATSIALAIIVLCYVIADIVVFRGIKRLDRLYRLEKNYLLAENQLRVQQEYYTNLMAHMQYTNKLRHDFRNQMQVAHALFFKGDTGRARLHLEQMEQTLAATEVSRCGHPLVDAVVMDKAALCEQKGIELETDLNISHDIAVAGLDLCSVVANIMDNAIEACEAVNDAKRKISLRAQETAGFLMITCRNSAVLALERTPKAEFLPERGLGLSIIQEIVEKYQGRVEVKQEPTEYAITIWIACAEQKSAGENREGEVR